MKSSLLKSDTLGGAMIAGLGAAALVGAYLGPATFTPVGMGTMFAVALATGLVTAWMNEDFPLPDVYTPKSKSVRRHKIANCEDALERIYFKSEWKDQCGCK